MLIKLLKYELKATSRLLLPLYSTLIVFAILIKIFLALKLNLNNVKFLGNIPFVLSIFVYGATMAAIIIVTVFIIIQRFYKNLLGNEGYLMHTLPVSTNNHIISKLIIGIFWSCISILVAILSIVIMSYSNHFCNYASYCFTDMYSQFGSKMLSFIIEFILAVFSQIALIIILIYTSISIGQLLPKIKLLGAFAAFIVLNIIMKMILYIPIMSIAVINPTNGIMKYFDNLSKYSPIDFFNILLLGGLIINIIWFIIYFIITKYILNNKLNLE